MAGESGATAAGSLPLRRFVYLLLFFSFFSIWVNSADPWWRTKEWVALILGAGWLALRSYLLPAQARRWKSLPLTLLLIWIVLQMLLIQVMPIIGSPGKLYQSPWPWLTFLHVVILTVWWTDIVQFFQREDYRRISHTIAVIGIVLSVYMIFQRFGVDPIIWYIQRHHERFKWLHENHVIGLVGNPFQASACLAVCVPAIVSRRWNVASLLAIVALCFTQSASGVAAGILGSVVVLLKQRRMRFILFAGLATAIGIFFFMNADFLSDSGRFAIWKSSLLAWGHSLWIGVGLSQYKLLGIKSVSQANSVSNVWWAHNEWIHFGTEMGLIGFALLLYWTFSIGRKLIRNLDGIPTVWIGTLVSCLVLTFVSIPWHLAPTAVVTLLAVAAVESD